MGQSSAETELLIPFCNRSWEYSIYITSLSLEKDQLGKNMIASQVTKAPLNL